MCCFLRLSSLSGVKSNCVSSAMTVPFLQGWWSEGLLNLATASLQLALPLITHEADIGKESQVLLPSMLCWNENGTQDVLIKLQTLHRQWLLSLSLLDSALSHLSGFLCLGDMCLQFLPIYKLQKSRTKFTYSCPVNWIYKIIMLGNKWYNFLIIFARCLS